MAYLSEVTPKARDAVYAMGEKLSIRVLALAFDTAGIEYECIDADTFLDTDSRFGSANPLIALGQGLFEVGCSRMWMISVCP